MKIRELDFFDDSIKQEFCNYLKKYFKEKCKVKWTGAKSILPSVTFESNNDKLGDEITVKVNSNCKIYLYGLNRNISLSKFVKYINVFLDKEYAPKKYIKEKDMKQILSLYNKLKITFKKDEIEDFYNAIQRAIIFGKEYYLFDTFIRKIDDKVEVVQEINDLSGDVDFKITINTEAGIKYTCVFSIDYDKLNILDIARKLTQLQLNLERVIKWSGIVWIK